MFELVAHLRILKFALSNGFDARNLYSASIALDTLASFMAMSCSGFALLDRCFSRRCFRFILPSRPPQQYFCSVSPVLLLQPIVIRIVLVIHPVDPAVMWEY